ncbi:MAG: MFS transporter [Simkaniaceae bacterium]|nr:MFS transporter [Simkaniaceae bacterium]
MNRQFWAAILGNFLDHYDKALYALIIPFVAQQFYPEVTYITALVLAYVPYSVVMQPIAFWVIRRYGHKMSMRKILLLSLVGMSGVTLGIGLTPLWSDIGVMAPIVLNLFRALSGLFASIESTAAPLFALDATEEKRRGWASCLYEMSSMGGVIIASAAVTLLAVSGKIEALWRLPFIIGGGLGLCGLMLRLRVEETERIEMRPFTLPNFRGMLSIAIVTGLICVNCRVVMEMMNSYIPLVSSWTKSDMMVMHLGLSCFDLVLLPILGGVAYLVGQRRLMVWSIAGLALFSIPLFLMLEVPSLERILIARLALIILGLGASVGYQNWCRSEAGGRDRFFTVAMGKMAGKKFISDPAISISFLLFGSFGMKLAPAFYISGAALLALFVLYPKTQEVGTISP